MAIENLTTETFDNLNERSNPVLVYFWAEWCGPCKMMKPVLEGIASDYEGKLDIVKINADEEPDIVGRYGISSIPAMIVLQSGEEAKRINGAKPKPALIKELSEFI
jgi:thioredoxin 1